MLKGFTCPLLTCLLFALNCSFGYAQTLTISNVDTTAYPTIRADYVASDAAGARLTDLTAADFRIIEKLSNGRTLNASASVSHDCVGESTSTPVSLMIVLDRSTSMDDRIGGVRRIDVAKNALRDLINSIDFGTGTRMCILGFAQRTVMLCNWTNDATDLTFAINSMTLSPGTNYNEPFYGNPNVFDEFSKCPPGTAKRMIFISDGFPRPAIPNPNAFVDDVTARARAQSIVMHSVTIDLADTYEPLKQICTLTGGTSTAGSSADVDAMIEAARKASIENLSCSVQWVSPPGCGPNDAMRTAVVTLLRGAMPSDSTRYQATQTSRVLTTGFGTFVTVSQKANAVVQFTIQPPTQVLADITLLTLELEYPAHMLDFVSEASETASAQIISDVGSTRGRRHFTVSVGTPFTSELQFAFEFTTLLSADTVAKITANVTTDISCLLTPPIVDEMIVSASCAGSSRVVKFGTGPFTLEQPYPNPANDALSVHYSLGYAAPSTYEVIDALGNVVKTMTIASEPGFDHQQTTESQPATDHRLSIPVHELSAGTYVLRFVSGHYVASRVFCVTR